jgi:predicted enzyme related to lactoylglutathione lyase
MTQTSPQTAPSTATTYQAPTAAAQAVAGRFVWRDLMSTDPERALAFYQALLGWSVERMPISPESSYMMIGLGGQHFGGIAPLDASAGLPSHWIGYLAVDDVDAATVRAAELGGMECAPPTDIPQVGRFSVVTDPTGAVLSLFSYLPGQEMALPTDPVPFGSFCWDELMSTDPDAAARFYEQLVGWSYAEHNMGEAGMYRMGGRSPSKSTGLMRLPDEAMQVGAPSHWLPYIRVSNVDASAARVAELGGAVLVPATDIPEIGRFAAVSDPTGAMFALYREA